MPKHSDPLTLLTQSMRRMATLSVDDITRGLENFANPSARGLLESLGKTRQEQIDALAGMLRNSSEEDMAEMAQIFGEAMAKLAEERSTPMPDRRAISAAEWRRQRRLAS